MSKLARSRHTAAASWLLAAAGLAATAAVLITFVAGRRPSQAWSSHPARPAAKSDPRHRAPVGTPDVLPELAAQTFASRYVSFLYGRLAAVGVAPATRALSRQLVDARSNATPAELSREVVVRDLMVIRRTATSATAYAVVDDGLSPPYGLSFNLNLARRHWLVTAVQESGQ